MLEIKDYNSEILSNISFGLKKDENLLILGQNGAGKSTLAQVLTNLISNNRVKIDNKNIDILNLKEKSQYINYIPPKLDIFDEYMTLYEFLELSFISKVEKEKIEKVIKLLKLEKLKNKPCVLFSSGEKQLTLLASALLHNAQITIFDELSANLDSKRLKEVFDILNSDLLQQKIIITHNLTLAYALKYKVLFLENGKIEFFGENKEFFEKENILKFYGNSIKKIDKYLVLDL